MDRALHLSIATPFEVLARETGVRTLRAEDASGSFGILPGHTDFLTVLPVSVVRWRSGDERMHYCALRGGVLSVTGGHEVAISCRRGMLGDDLELLAENVRSLQAEEEDAERRVRTGEMRMQARAVRQLMSYLRGGPSGHGGNGRFGEGQP